MQIIPPNKLMSLLKLNHSLYQSTPWSYVKSGKTRKAQQEYHSGVHSNINLCTLSLLPDYHSKQGKDFSFSKQTHCVAPQSPTLIQAFLIIKYTIHSVSY